MMKFSLLSSLGLLGFCMAGLAASSTAHTQVLLTPIADARLLSVFPTQNDGSSDFLSVYNMPGNGGSPDNIQHSLIKFDLSGISSVSSATLTLTYNMANPAYTDQGHATYAYRASQDWSESAVTWNSTGSVDWTMPGGDFDSSLVAVGDPSTVTKTFDVTSLVQTWVSGAFTNYGFYLSGDPNNQAHFYSKEDPTASNRPLLTISTGSIGIAAVPEPGSVALLTGMMTMSGAFLLRRKRVRN